MTKKQLERGAWYMCKVSDRQNTWEVTRPLLWLDRWHLSKGNAYTTDDDDQQWMIKADYKLIRAATK